MTQGLPFLPAPRARADLRPGVVYAVNGEDSFIYYGQVAPNKQLGFFRFRSRTLSIAESLSSEFMSRFIVSLPSIGRALRSGTWLSLGRHDLRSELVEEAVFVQWPVGTLEVTLWKGGKILKTTRVDDPEIQHFEIIAAYDAAFHVPRRLRTDFTQADDAWSVGGSVLRHRRMKQETAIRHPDQPWHRLPAEWVPV